MALITAYPSGCASHSSLSWGGSGSSLLPSTRPGRSRHVDREGAGGPPGRRGPGPRPPPPAGRGQGRGPRGRGEKEPPTQPRSLRVRPRPGERPVPPDGARAVTPHLQLPGPRSPPSSGAREPRPERVSLVRSSSQSFRAAAAVPAVAPAACSVVRGRSLLGPGPLCVRGGEQRPWPPPAGAGSAPAPGVVSRRVYGLL